MRETCPKGCCWPATAGRDRLNPPPVSVIPFDTKRPFTWRKCGFSQFAGYDAGIRHVTRRLPRLLRVCYVK